MVNIINATLITLLCFDTLRPLNYWFEVSHLIYELFSPTLEISMIIRKDKIYQVSLVYETSGTMEFF